MTTQRSMFADCCELLSQHKEIAVQETRVYVLETMWNIFHHFCFAAYLHCFHVVFSYSTNNMLNGIPKPKTWKGQSLARICLFRKVLFKDSHIVYYNIIYSPFFSQFLGDKREQKKYIKLFSVKVCLWVTFVADLYQFHISWRSRHKLVHFTCCWFHRLEGTT